MWETPLADLRKKLNDGDTDKLRALKKCVGNSDGLNTTFKTFEYRRITNFAATGYESPFGVYINGTIIPSGAVASDQPESGFFSLTGAPEAGAEVSATYYLRWFLDEELNEFLMRAGNWLSSSDEYVNLPRGLWPAALAYAAAEAYQKLTLKVTEQLADIYQLEGGPKEGERSPVDYYKSLTKMFADEATRLRDQFYTRQGRPLQPLYASVVTGVPRIVPRR